MIGIITARHVVCHPWIVVHEFGGAVLWHAVAAVILRRRVTFLSLVTRYGK